MPYHEIHAGNVEEAEKLLKSKGNVAIRIHMAGCGACHGMEDAWDSVKRLATKNTAIYVMNVDSGAASLLASKGYRIFDVNGFPTMVDKYGKEHAGSRSAEDLTRWASRAGKRGPMSGGKSRSRRRRTMRRRRQTRRKTHQRGGKKRRTRRTRR